jgi:hypothetical protein
MIDGLSPITVSRSGFETTIPITVSESLTKVQIRRRSPNWRELEVTVMVQSVEGKPAAVGIQR